MKDIILGLPKQFNKGVAAAAGTTFQGSYRRIISCGVGGSSIPGEILSMVRDDVVNHWDYDLPSNCNKDDLVICTSWSGNTEEPISSYEKAVTLGIDTLTITDGGKLLEIAKANQTPFIDLPNPGIPPRTATGYMTGALFAALGMENQLPSDLDAAVLEIKGQELARQFGGKIPVIYTSYPWRKLTGFWKMCFSETTKRHVFGNWFPSGAHTEIVGWAGPYQETFVPVIIHDRNENPRYTRNFDALLAIFSKRGYNVATIELSGNTLLEKVFNNYILALWTGLAVAQKLGVDPKKTELLDEFKRLKAKKS